MGKEADFDVRTFFTVLLRPNDDLITHTHGAGGHHLRGTR
jgi:hypothetical protein